MVNVAAPDWPAAKVPGSWLLLFTNAGRTWRKRPEYWFPGATSTLKDAAGDVQTRDGMVGDGTVDSIELAVGDIVGVAMLVVSEGRIEVAEMPDGEEGVSPVHTEEPSVFKTSNVTA